MDSTPKKYDWSEYRIMRDNGRPPREAIAKAKQAGYERIQIWFMLHEVYDLDQAMQKTAWCESEGMKLAPEFETRLRRLEKYVSDRANERRPK